MVNQNIPGNEEKPLVVRRGRVDSVDLYEVKENELDLLEKGSPATLQLNFAIFLLSMAVTCIATLTTTTFKWPIVETIFVFVSILGIFIGGYLIISWWRTRTSIAGIIVNIKSRIADEASPLKSPNQSAPDTMSDEAPSG